MSDARPLGTYETKMAAPDAKGSIYVYSYFEKGCRKKCARDNPER